MSKLFLKIVIRNYKGINLIEKWLIDFLYKKTQPKI